MSKSATASAFSDSSSMAVRAAWLHYAGGHTQAEVARKLGLTSLKAHRLITRANSEGLVKVYIDGVVAECVALEAALSTQYSLEYCEVVPDLDEPELPLRALGAAGAQLLKRTLEDSEHASIGIGHGRTLAACVNNLPRVARPDKQIVSLLGGFSRKFEANPHDVIHLLAQKTSADAYVMPVPFFANSVKDKKVILKQAGMDEVMKLARETTTKIAGIGAVDNSSSMVANAMVEKKELRAVYRAGARGEMLGQFFDAQGKPVQTELSERTMGLTLRDLQDARITAIAGGSTKVRAIQSVLRSGLLNGLIVDERSASALAGVRAPREERQNR